MYEYMRQCRNDAFTVWGSVGVDSLCVLYCYIQVILALLYTNLLRN